VRSGRGRSSAWFRGIQLRHAGRIRASGVERDAAFVEARPDIDDRPDAAHRREHRGYMAGIAGITRPAARAATLKLVPR